MSVSAVKRQAMSPRTGWRARAALALALAVLGSLLVGLPAAAQTEGPGLQPVTAAPAASDAQLAAVLSIDLCAQTGSWDVVGGTTVPIWGFTLDDGSCGAAAQLPGPVLGIDTPTR
jgi:FtsP/CotA-like multicopper oxidase with cupredoxin domain